MVVDILVVVVILFEGSNERVDCGPVVSKWKLFVVVEASVTIVVAVVFGGFVVLKA